MTRLSIAVLALLAAAACSKSGSGTNPPEGKAPAESGPREVAEVEPNDTVAAATSLSGASRITAELKADAKGDDDLYRLEAAGAGKVATFEVTGIPGVDIRVELLDRDGNPVASFNSEGEGGGEKVANVGLNAPWIVKVAPVKRGSGGSYTATVTLGDADPDAEVEPNNRAVDATPLPLDKPLKGLIADKADEDWYRIEVPVPTPTSAPAPGGAEPAPQGAPPSGEPGTPAPAPAQPTPAPSGEAPSGGTAAPEPGADAGQDGPSAAAPPVAVVKLDIAGVPDVRLQVEVANEAQAVFYTARSREPGEGIQVRNLALRPGETTYFVIVKSAWTGVGKDARRGSNAAEPYTLTVAAEQAGANAELEPNDEAAKATPIPVDGMRQGFLAPKGDVDYFRVTADSPRLLRIELSGIDRVDAMLSLVSVPSPDAAAPGDKEEMLLRANDGGVREGELLVNVAAGPGRDVLIRVEAAPRQVDGKWVRDQENATEPYRLTISSRPDDGAWEREPNNSVAAAAPIEFGRATRGHVHPKKDVDFFQLDLTKSLVKVPIRANLSGILKVDVTLGLYRVDEEGKLTLVQRSEKGKGDQPESIRYAAEPGLYVLEVRDTRNLQSNFIDAYQLVVEQEQ